MRRVWPELQGTPPEPTVGIGELRRVQRAWEVREGVRRLGWVRCSTCVRERRAAAVTIQVTSASSVSAERG